MKQLIIGILLVTISLPFVAKSQQQKGFEITGHIDGVLDGEKVVLGHYPFTWHPLLPFGPISIDSCFVKNGEFHLSGVVQDGGPNFFTIVFEYPKHNNNKYDAGNKYCQLFADNGEKIVIHGGDIDKINQRDIGPYLGIDGPSQIAFSA